MREIKFRGICRYGKEFVYGSLLCQKRRTGTDIEGNVTKEMFYIIKNYETVSTYEDIKEETIGQYTGLKDKNGKEIYEGDIIEYKNNGNLQRDVVRFEYGEFCLTISTYSLYVAMDNDVTHGVTNLEIIGNIYESPDLIDNG